MGKTYTTTIFVLLTVLNLCSSYMLKLDAGHIGSSPGKACGTSQFHSLIDESKYSIEEHNATTEDGYVLKMFRVRLKEHLLKSLPEQYKKNANQPLLIMHGIEDSADAAYQNGDGKAYGFHYVNKGYDVWSGNNRGNKYSKTHTNPKIESKEFYDFSWQEMGLLDLPAFYKLILSQSPYDENTKIIYNGHSEGTTQFFVAAIDESTKDYIKSKTLKFIAFAPIVYMTKVDNKILPMISKLSGAIANVTNALQIWNIPSLGCFDQNNAVIQGIVGACKLPLVKNLCDAIEKNTIGSSEIHNVPEILPTYLAHDFSGSSARQLIHYAQLIAGDKNGNPIFQKYDFGEVDNMKHYNQKTPPAWPLKDFNVPSAFLTGGLDVQGTPENEANTAKDLNPNTFTTKQFPKWTHMTYNVPRDPTDLFAYLDEILPKTN